jgi:hypothetical protein
MLAIPSMGGSSGQFGMMAVPMTTGRGTQSGSGTSIAGTAADPLGLSYIYGPAVPMTAGQAGLFMLSTQQRMLGLGNGQISGVRPGATPDAKAVRGARTTMESHPVEAHTKNANVPGGQAARFFNRGGLATSRSRPYYNRQLRYFPQTGQ